MGQRRIPDYKTFQTMMWQAMSDDESWMILMDNLSYRMPKGEPWPHELKE